MTHKAVALVSGGLDSLLALAAIARQGIETIAFHGTSVFVPKSDSPEGRAHIEAVSRACGAADVVIRDMTPSMIAFTKAPSHGYGKNMNACLDCRANTIRLAKEVMDKVGAECLVTGEVIGQRPMSQHRRAMKIVDKDIAALGLAGRLVRPLSAKLLEPTIPETEGWIDREALFAFEGRTRTPQTELAKEWNITDYESPAGGCLLTDISFAAKLRDLMQTTPEWGEREARLLRVGRHIRLTPQTKLIASRNEGENNLLGDLAAPGEEFFLTDQKPGALILLTGEATPEARGLAGKLAVFYSKFRAEGTGPVKTWQAPATEDAATILGNFPPDDAAALRIG